MSNIINFNEYKKTPEPKDPHLCFPAKCKICNSEWIAVAPIGTRYLNCQVCEAETGEWTQNIIYADDLYWTCHCGNDELMYAKEHGLHCKKCGIEVNV